MSRRKGSIRRFRRWHARVGIAAALVLLFLVITGLALNHSQALRLDVRRVANPWLMQWYGLRPATPTDAFFFATGYLAWDDERWVMDGRVIARNMPSPVGAVEVAGIRYVATASGLYLYLPAGQLMDRIEKQTLPSAPIMHLGIAGGRIVLKTPTGAYASREGLTWQKAKAAAVTWSVLQRIPPAVLKEQAPLFAPSLPLERIVLDLHSGRLFGRYGPLAVDLTAVALLVLVVSGFWMYRHSLSAADKRPHSSKPH